MTLKLFQFFMQNVIFQILKEINQNEKKLSICIFKPELIRNKQRIKNFILGWKNEFFFFLSQTQYFKY